MLVVTRFRADLLGDPQARALRSDLEAVRDLLAARPGYLDGSVARSLDDPALWLLLTRWEGVGAYRRALSSYEFKMHGLPRYTLALDEPGAYEVVEPDAVLDQASARVT